ncbi:MAG TPA: POTRA domain-containing protein [Polyangiaceae bacterium]|nr:POTRA domain-containing protein [Polyangiaceae bacterium]
MCILPSQARARCLKGALKELLDPRLGGRILCALLVLFTAIACAHTPPPGHQVVTAVDIRGDTTGEEAELRRGIATRADVPYDPSTLAKDLARIQRFYRARGYYEATTRAARVLSNDKDGVSVEIVVVPGPPVRVTRIDLPGIDGLAKSTIADARDALELKVGTPLDERRFHADARALEAALANDGYAFARVEEHAIVAAAHKTAVLEYRVSAGLESVIGDVQIEGLRDFDRRVVYGKLALDPGMRFSRRALDLARRRVSALGVFSNVEVNPVLDHPDDPRVPVRVVVAEGGTHAVHVGAALESDTNRTRAAVRGGWESRNFLGGLRKLSFTVTPGLTFYPIGTEGASVQVLPELETALEVEQPAILDPRTTGYARSEFNIYPVIYADYNPGDNIIGFRELKDALGAERPFFQSRLRARASYNFEARFPFMYLGPMPAGLDTVLVLYPELVLDLDLRDDPIEPRSGAYFQVATQVAGTLVGDAKDVRLRPEARLYAKLGANLTLGWRGTLGLLFPDRCGSSATRGCYGDSLSQNNSSADQSALTRDQQILLFRGFYSGGATSNRGYLLNEVGPHGVLGFLAPTNINCTVMNPPPECEQPLGGLTLWEMSLELRVTLSDLAGVVFFVDTSDVTRDTVSFRLAYPHLSAGSGFRLRTPVGAVRFDLGVRVPYLQHVGEPELPPGEGEPDRFLGLPMAFHFGLGEAF